MGASVSLLGLWTNALCISDTTALSCGLSSSDPDHVGRQFMITGVVFCVVTVLLLGCDSFCTQYSPLHKYQMRQNLETRFGRVSGMQLPHECTARLGTRNLLFLAPLLGLLAVIFWTPALLSWAYLHYSWPQLEPQEFYPHKAPHPLDTEYPRNLHQLSRTMTWVKMNV